MKKSELNELLLGAEEHVRCGDALGAVRKLLGVVKDVVASGGDVTVERAVSLDLSHEPPPVGSSPSYPSG